MCAVPGRSITPHVWNCLGAGHGEAFGSEDCVPNTDCAPASGWMLSALLGIGMCYVVLVLWLPVNHHPLWKSITYFMQTAPLVSSPDSQV